MEQKEISKAVISRLPRYYRYLGELLEEGVERISSNDLSIRMKVTASQIRQDLNNFGGFGQQGYGYNVKYLYSEIARILGIDRQHNLIIIGAGNLGQAIANYTNFERRGFIIKGMFDVNPRLVGLVVRGVEIRGIESLEQFIKDNEVQIAALTIPKSKAPEIAERRRAMAWSFVQEQIQPGVDNAWRESRGDIGKGMESVPSGGGSQDIIADHQGHQAIIEQRTQDSNIRNDVKHQVDNMVTEYKGNIGDTAEQHTWRGKYCKRTVF